MAPGGCITGTAGLSMLEGRPVQHQGGAPPGITNCVSPDEQTAAGASSRRQINCAEINGAEVSARDAAQANQDRIAIAGG